MCVRHLPLMLSSLHTSETRDFHGQGTTARPLGVASLHQGSSVKQRPWNGFLISKLEVWELGKQQQFAIKPDKFLISCARKAFSSTQSRTLKRSSLLFPKAVTMWDCRSRTKVPCRAKEMGVTIAFSARWEEDSRIHFQVLFCIHI